MTPKEMEARLYAEQQVMEKFNVKFSWISYPGNVPDSISTDILRSILAGDPMAEIVHVFLTAQGSLLAANVLQPLDQYESIFDDEDSRWMFMGKVFGGHYFLNDALRYGAWSPLVYNIGLLNRVPALKEDGKLVLPVDLWLEGKWTWSAFEDYLQKISDFFRNDSFVYPYPGNYNASVMAMHSNGASIYGDRGLELDNPRAKEAVAFIENLMARNLIWDDMPPNNVPWWDMDWRRFLDGGYAFAHVTQDVMRTGMERFNERGDTMGVVPFPRPDRMGPDDPEYRQLNDVENNYAIPRGLDPQIAELAVRAFREYMVSYYKKMANSDRALDYLQSDDTSRAAALSVHLDITNEEYGDKILEAWKYLGNNENLLYNEYFRAVGLFAAFTFDTLLPALYRANGASQYSVFMETRMPVINSVLNDIQRGVDSEGVLDRIPPRFVDIENFGIVFPVGTNQSEINWNLFLQVSDNVDSLDFSGVTVNLSGVDFTKPGRYENAASFSVQDAAGNEGRAERTVIVFDGENTVPPSLTIRNNFRSIRINENTADINWRDDFVESATDKDGLDIRDSVFADLSHLNATVAGTYSVTISAKDYAGNAASADITVSVE